MKIGDKLLFIGNYDDYFNFVKGKEYKIFYIDDTTFEDERCCWIIDENGNQVYFRESKAIDNNFKCIKYERKTKLEKINLT